MATKKKSSTIIKKKTVSPRTSVKNSKKVAKKTPVKKASPKKVVSKKTPISLYEEKLAKEALKRIDQASELLRQGIKTSVKTSAEVRSALHEEAHSLLGEATRHLDHALKSGAAFLCSTISKI